MARIRTIKPEFWTSEQVMDVSIPARCLFIGLWNFCDDAGIHPASEKSLKAKVFPGDDITSADVRRMIDELIGVGLLVEYIVDGESFWQVTGWHHQKIDQPTCKYPTADGTIPPLSKRRRRATRVPAKIAANVQVVNGECSANTSRMNGEHSPNVHGVFEEGSGSVHPPEGKGREGSKPKTVNPKEALAAVPPQAREDSPPAPLVKDEIKPNSRAAAISLLMRANGIEGCNAANPFVIAWADNPRVTDDLLLTAASMAKDRPNVRRPGPSYVDPIIEELLDPPKPKPKPDDWHRSDGGITRKAKELGVSARAGETYAMLKDRVFEAIRRREQPGAAA